MLSLKSESTEAGRISFNPVQSELEHWERLIFSFDMDKDPSHSDDTNNRRARRPRSASQAAGSQADIQDAALLAQFAASAGMSQSAPGSSHDYPYEALALALRSAHAGNPMLGFPPTYFQQEQLNQARLPPIAPPTYPWPQMPAHYPPQNPYGSPAGGPSLDPGMFGFSNPGSYGSLPPIDTNVGQTRRTPSLPPTASTSAPASSPEGPEQTEAERIASAEDKRRRNTAASARFRIKKKQKSINLERSVQDLTGRAEELEKEAAELRRENGWLKEIVMLKGSRLNSLPNLELPPDEGEGSSRHMSGTSVEASGAGDAAESEEDSEEEKESTRRSTRSRGKGKEKEKSKRK